MKYMIYQSFYKLYNSSNIEEIKGQSFDNLICSGAPGTKWFADKYPSFPYTFQRG